MRKRKSLEKSLEVIQGGGEPTINPLDFKLSLIKALNWYNANWSEKEFRKSAEQYLKSIKQKDGAKLVAQGSFQEIRVIAVVGRLMAREQFVDDDMMAKATADLAVLKERVVPQKKVIETKTKPVQGIQDKILESAKTHAAEVDAAIDEFCTNGTEFSMKQFIHQNRISGVVAKKIGSMYTRLLSELDLAYQGKDEQLKEGYAKFGRRKLKKFLDLIKTIVSDCEQQVVSAKAQRKPRIRKPKPASVQVKNVKYLKEFPDLKLTSLTPDKIIGAKDLWLYNTATRKLTWLKAADSGVLGITGTSVNNFDIVESGTKTIRKPEEFFKALSGNNKRALANAWKTIKTKPSQARGRINQDMIIIGVN